MNREFNVTVLYATHHPLEAQEVAGRVIILDRGRVVADGKPEELIRGSGVGESIAVEVYGVYFDLNKVLGRVEANYVNVRPMRLFWVLGIVMWFSPNFSVNLYLWGLRLVG